MPPSGLASEEPSPPLLTCRWCGCEHHRLDLAPGERAMCSRCGNLLARRSRFGPTAPLAFTLAGAALLIPALILPFVTVDRLRKEQVAYLFTGIDALWADDMKLLSVWVALCAILAPAVLLVMLGALVLPPRPTGSLAIDRYFWRTAHAIEQWAMPEVHLLAVLVALTKLGSLVNITVGPGLWCYAAMAAMILLAWRSFEFGSREMISAPAPAQP